MSLAHKKVCLVSYHAFQASVFRPMVVDRYFLEMLEQQRIASYESIFSDWDHISKARHPGDMFSHRPIAVPAYRKNISVSRILSHLVFSLKLVFRRALWNSDIFFVSAPPSFSALVVTVVARLRGARVVIDVIDLWPEALPVPPAQKRIFMNVVGRPWIFLRNLLYRNTDALLCHCQYFKNEIGVNKAPNAFYLPLSQNDSLVMDIVANRVPLAQEIRILLLGSINHVLAGSSLRAVAAQLAQICSQPICIEIVGAGETKAELLESLSAISPAIQVVDHGMVFDTQKKAEILARCHLGFNGYKATTAIGITYKAVDFASGGIVFLNSLQGDLNELVASYGAGFNYKLGQEDALAESIVSLSQDRFNAMSAASKKIAQDRFHPEKFKSTLSQILHDLGST